MSIALLEISKKGILFKRTFKTEERGIAMRGFETLDSLLHYARLFEKAIKNYQESNNGRLPTQQELVEILSIERTKISRMIPAINRADLGIIIRTFRSGQKKATSVSDQEIRETYNGFLNESSVLPTQKELADSLGIALSVLSRRIRRLNRDKSLPPVITKGMGRADNRKRKRDNFCFSRLVDTVQEYRRGHQKQLPNQDELAGILGVSQHAVSYQLKKVNIERLSQGRIFIRTRGSREFTKLQESKKVGSSAAAFSELRGAVRILFGWLNSVLKDRDLLKDLNGGHLSSVVLIRDFFIACKKALKIFLQREAFFVFPLAEENRGYCSGDKLYLCECFVEPKKKRYQGTRFLAEILFYTLISSLFSSQSLIEKMMEKVIK